MIRQLAIVTLLLLPAHSPTLADSVTGAVARVIDGDTVVVESAGNSLRVRLADIDTPETKQPYGPEAKDALSDMADGKGVVVTYTRRDRYGRILGTVWVAGVNVNERLVRSGYAWRYRYARKTGVIAEAERFAGKTGVIAEAERFAREKGLGLWGVVGAVEPLEYRKGRR